MKSMTSAKGMTFIDSCLKFFKRVLFTVATQLRKVFKTILVSETGLSRDTKAIVSPAFFSRVFNGDDVTAVKNRR